VNGLDERRARAVATAIQLSSTAGVLLDVAADLRSKATELRIAASETRFRQAPASTRASCVDKSSAWFTVRGIVDGRPTSALWSPGYLDCGQELMRRVQVVVAMGERFGLPWSPTTTVAASLEGPPVIVLLTVMRAFSGVTSIDLHDTLLHNLDHRGLRRE
jgi:hypothetical protein